MTSQDVTAVMADGIGELTFASAEWVSAARTEMTRLLAETPLPNVKFTLCEVGHNAPVWMHAGDKLAWYMRLVDGALEMGAHELPESECDFKVQADHSILSNLACVVHAANPADIVAAVVARLTKLTRWKLPGKSPGDADLQVLLQRLHDAMALRTMPRFVWMSPEWVVIARRFLTSRATSDKYRADLAGVDYVFVETFFHTPEFFFPDGAAAGFWVHCSNGEVTVGSGSPPDGMPSPDALTQGWYGACLPVGRTVDAVANDSDKAAQRRYKKAAFSHVSGGLPAAAQSSPSGRDQMPRPLARVFAPMHDTMSKRTSGELPSDYAPDDAPWGEPQEFDRTSGYDTSWLRYDRVDLYGNDRQQESKSTDETAAEHGV